MPQIGRILDVLDAHKLWDSTIVVLMADHGLKMGNYNAWCKNGNFGADTRVPLMVHVPGAAAARGGAAAVVRVVERRRRPCEKDDAHV